MSGIKKGSQVRKVVPDIVGTVLDARVNDELEIEYLVQFSGADGEPHQRWFAATELQAEPSQ